MHHYREDLGAFAKWWKKQSDDALTPAAITELDLDRWHTHLCETPVGRAVKRARKPATVNAKIAAMRSFLRWAKRYNVIEEIPETPPRQKLGHRMVRWLDKKQQHQLLRRAAHNKRDYAVIVILIETGLRVAELVALRWYDIDMKKRKGWLTVRAGKGRKPRGMPLSRDALKVLQAMREPGVGPDAAVFMGQRGELKVRGVQDLLLKYEDPRVGLDNLTPHMLRHTFAINLRDRGVPYPTIAALMGHGSSKTTMDNYGVASVRDLETAINPFEEEEE